MVSKVAVMALVGILAVPILLGYGLNLSEVTHSEYTPNDESVDVTRLLQNGKSSTYVAADPYTLNTNFGSGTNTWDKQLPIYEKMSTTKTTFPLTQSYFGDQVWNNTSQFVDLPYFYEKFFYDYNYNSHKMDVYAMVNGSESLILTLNNIYSFYYSNVSNDYSWETYGTAGPGLGNLGHGNADITKTVLTTISGTANLMMEYYDSTISVDPAGGFHFISVDVAGSNAKRHLTTRLPGIAENALITIDLGSVGAYNCRFDIVTDAQVRMTFIKETVNGIISWKVRMVPEENGSNAYTNLYYDQSSSNNVYQLNLKIKDLGSYGGYTYNYRSTADLNYIGAWPTEFGPANPYLTYSFTSGVTSFNTPSYQYVTFSMLAQSGYLGLVNSPVLRIDSANFTAFDYPAIVDNTYTPANFKENPATTISGISQYGSAIQFGSNSYDVVSGGNIMLGTHKTSINGIVFDSVPIIGGGYENRINGEVVEVTVQPAQIKFIGTWVAAINTDSQSVTTYTKTEWTPGEFAWDGIDQNFLMVGLLTCLGVFVGLGIYLRKTKSSMWPLLIVCGCAACLFICML